MATLSLSVYDFDNRRVCVASPAYLNRRGTPQSLADLAHHDCLALGASAN